MKQLKKILKFLKKPVFRNRYFITAFAFLLWLCFFDRNDIISQFKLRNELQKMQNNKQYYYEEITRTQSDLQDLLTNPAKLEKFAREKYLMKRDDEDVYIIVKE